MDALRSGKSLASTSTWTSTVALTRFRSPSPRRGGDPVPDRRVGRYRPASLVRRLERRIHDLESALVEARTDHAASGQEAERARARIGTPFEHEGRLRTLQRRQSEITEQLVPTPDEPPTALSEPSAAERMAARLESQDVAPVSDSVDDLDQPAGRTMSMPTSAAASRVTMKRGARRPAEIGLAADCHRGCVQLLQDPSRAAESRSFFSDIKTSELLRDTVGMIRSTWGHDRGSCAPYVPSGASRHKARSGVQVHAPRRGRAISSVVPRS